SPVTLSRQESVVATRRLAIGRPSWVRRISGSAPRLPTRMTLFTLPAMTALHHFPFVRFLLAISVGSCTRKFRVAKRSFQAAPCAKAGARASPRLPGLQAYPQTHQRPLPTSNVLYLFLSDSGAARKSFARTTEWAPANHQQMLASCCSGVTALPPTKR